MLNYTPSLFYVPSVWPPQGLSLPPPVSASLSLRGQGPGRAFQPSLCSPVCPAVPGPLPSQLSKTLVMFSGVNPLLQRQLLASIQMELTGHHQAQPVGAEAMVVTGGTSPGPPGHLLCPQPGVTDSPLSFWAPAPSSSRVQSTASHRAGSVGKGAGGQGCPSWALPPVAPRAESGWRWRPGLGAGG